MLPLHRSLLCEVWNCLAHLFSRNLIKICFCTKQYMCYLKLSKFQLIESGIPMSVHITNCITLLLVLSIAIGLPFQLYPRYFWWIVFWRCPHIPGNLKTLQPITICWANKYIDTSIWKNNFGNHDGAAPKLMSHRLGHPFTAPMDTLM